MANKVKIEIFSLKWHHGSSDSMNDIIINPFLNYFLYSKQAWDGNDLKSIDIHSSNLLFWMLPPNSDELIKNNNTIWVPMWDQAQEYSTEWWNSLPKNLKIVSFSKNISASKCFRFEYSLNILGNKNFNIHFDKAF